MAEVQRQVISKSVKTKALKGGGNQRVAMEQVVYKREVGKSKGVMKYSSQTCHEPVKA